MVTYPFVEMYINIETCKFKCIIRVFICMHGFLAANAKHTDGCIAVLEEDGTLIDDDDVVNELERTQWLW